MTRLRGFAHLQIDRPVIRRGKSGHFCDKALEGVSHHAIVPNVNVMDDLEVRIARLSDDEKRLFALICRSYLAAVMPDFEYRQTVVTMKVPLPERGTEATAEFRAVGRIPLKPGWKEAFGAAEPEQGREKEGEAETEQTLPRLVDGQTATLTQPRVQAKETQPPPRYNEGTLVDAMQNAWRFVKDEALRDRLKEAKGIGTPATRAEIIKGLKRQNLLAADGKLVVPTTAGLQLLRVAARRRPRAGRSRHHGGLGDAARRCRGGQGRFPGRHRRDRRRGGAVDLGAAAAHRRYREFEPAGFGRHPTKAVQEG